MSKKLTALSGTTNIMSAVLLFCSWFSIGIFMRDEIMSMDFMGMVLNTAWIPVNIMFLIATVMLLPGIIGWYFVLPEKKGALSLAAFLLTVLAVVWFSSIQYYETFFWPVIAAESPDLFKAVGFSPSNKLVFVPFILSGIPWAFGYVLTGIITYRSKLITKTAAIIYTLGALLFGVGMAFPVRTVGVLLFCFGLIKIGFVLKRGI